MPIQYEITQLREPAQPREIVKTAIAIFNEDPERYRREHRDRVIQEQKAMKNKILSAETVSIPKRVSEALNPSSVN